MAAEIVQVAGRWVQVIVQVAGFWVKVIGRVAAGHG